MTLKYVGDVALVGVAVGLTWTPLDYVRSLFLALSPVRSKGPVVGQVARGDRSRAGRIRAGDRGLGRRTGFAQASISRLVPVNARPTLGFGLTRILSVAPGPRD